MTSKLLANQLRGILNEPVEGFTVELSNESNLFDWIVWIEGPKDTYYEGGVFQLSLHFPKDYPMSPPELKFVSDFWHPNVFTTGKVCMSILHPPGEDAMSGELPEERWLPTQSVTTIILSLLSLLNDPNCSSPANVDASVEWHNHRVAFKNRCAKLVEKANRERPPHVVIPHPESDADQHRRRIQKFHEMNKDLDYEDFYENEVENPEENTDENDFSESDNDEINTDDEQSPKGVGNSPVVGGEDGEIRESKKVNEGADILEISPEMGANVKKDVKGKGKVDEKEKEKEKEKDKEITEDFTKNVDDDVAVSTTNNSSNSSLPSSNTSLSQSSNSNNINNNNSEISRKGKRKGKKAKKPKCVIM